jgi:hypothetical protein
LGALSVEEAIAKFQKEVEEKNWWLLVHELTMGSTQFVCRGANSLTKPNKLALVEPGRYNTFVLRA